MKPFIRELQKCFESRLCAFLCFRIIRLSEILPRKTEGLFKVLHSEASALLQQSLPTTHSLTIMNYRSWRFQHEQCSVQTDILICCPPFYFVFVLFCFSCQKICSGLNSPWGSSFFNKPCGCQNTSKENPCTVSVDLQTMPFPLPCCNFHQLLPGPGKRCAVLFPCSFFSLTNLLTSFHLNDFFF